VIDAGHDAGAVSALDAQVEPTADTGLDATGQLSLDAGQDGAVLPDAGDALVAAGDASADAAIVDARVVDAGPPKPVCSVMAPTSCPDPAPTYKQVALIIEERCESCHSPRWTGPWPLDNYQHVADWQDTIRSNMLDCSMPPPETGLTMPNEERMVILNWLRCGLPQ